MPDLRTLRNFINGESVTSADGRTSEVISPVSGKAYATAPVSGAEDVDRAMKAAEAAFGSWRETTPSQRQAALLKLADAMEARADEIVQVESENTGKPIGLTHSEEIPPMVDQVRFFAGAARVLEGRSAGEYLAGHTSWVRREPVGGRGQVTPGNCPAHTGGWW